MNTGSLKIMHLRVSFKISSEEGDGNKDDEEEGLDYLWRTQGYF